jgi:threonine synthase
MGKSGLKESTSQANVTSKADLGSPTVTAGVGSVFACGQCGQPYPQTGYPYRCLACGGLFEFAQSLSTPAQLGPTRRGLARFQSVFSWLGDMPVISLGEGGTPLLPLSDGRDGKYLKCEQLNPTGSFKDRGTAVLVSTLAAGGVTEAIEDSSGNAGASFAAYAARAGIRARVFVPAYASGPKRVQIEAYGANLIPVSGPRSKASEAALQAVEAGAVYASHAYLPFGQAGMATLAFELVDQLGGPPGTVIIPVGQGTLYLGLYLGFRALKKSGAIQQLPRLVGVQTRACPPLWSAWNGSDWQAEEVDTLAEGIRIIQPLRKARLLEAARETQGDFVAVDEAQIASGRRALSRHGLFVEPTSAVIWPVLGSAETYGPGPWVAVLTGSGMKDPRLELETGSGSSGTGSGDGPPENSSGTLGRMA